MSAGIKAALMGAKRKTVTVPCPEIGEDVTLCEILLTERDALAALTIVEVDGKKTVHNEGFRERLLVRCILNGDGERAYTDDEAPKLSTLPISLADRLFTAAQELNGMGAKAVEEARKNFESGPSSASAIDSPPSSGTP